jgi:hypothetical protein
MADWTLRSGTLVSVGRYCRQVDIEGDQATIQWYDSRWRLMRIVSIALALLISTAAYGQSLGDVARENREEKEKQKAASASAPQPRVITNKDLPQDREQTADGPQTVPSSNANDTDQATAENSAEDPVARQHLDHQHIAVRRVAERRVAGQRLAEQRAAEQWKRQILAQKHKLANLQARIDQLSASIQAANGSTQYEGPNGRAQARQLQRIAQIQLQIDQQKITLLEMQEAARRAGMHTVVYDP